jgi:hypothetical protein
VDISRRLLRHWSGEHLTKARQRPCDRISLSSMVVCMCLILGRATLRILLVEVSQMFKAIRTFLEKYSNILPHFKKSFSFSLSFYSFDFQELSYFSNSNVLKYAQPMIKKLLLPPSINNSTPIHLPPLQHHLSPPLRHINRINKPRRLNTKPTSRPTSRHSLHLRNINILPCIELECRLRAQYFQMDF